MSFATWGSFQNGSCHKSNVSSLSEQQWGSRELFLRCKTVRPAYVVERNTRGSVILNNGLAFVTSLNRSLFLTKQQWCKDDFDECSSEIWQFCIGDVLIDIYKCFAYSLDFMLLRLKFLQLPVCFRSNGCPTVVQWLGKVCQGCIQQGIW